MTWPRLNPTTKFSLKKALKINHWFFDGVLRQLFKDLIPYGSSECGKESPMLMKTSKKLHQAKEES